MSWFLVGPYILEEKGGRKGKDDAQSRRPDRCDTKVKHKVGKGM